MTKRPYDSRAGPSTSGANEQTDGSTLRVMEGNDKRNPTDEDVNNILQRAVANLQIVDVVINFVWSK